jgi:predicted permease
MNRIGQDLRYAVRGLTRNPAFTVVAVLTLALGIGCNTAMFTVLNAVLLRPLPYPSSNQLVMLWTELPGQGLQEGRSTYADVEEWRRQAGSVVDMAVWDPVSLRLTAPGDVQQISSVRISPNFFSLLGVRPVRGRVFSAEEADRRSRVAVISHRLWQSRFGGSESVIGATIGLDGATSEVIGVLGPDFNFPGADGDVLEPQTLFSDWDARRGVRGPSSWFVLGRLKPGVSTSQAQLELSALASRLAGERTASGRAAGINVAPLSSYVVQPTARLALLMLTGAVFCVLLICVANITNLSLARSAGRDREIAIRSALGASKTHLVQQLVTESLALSLLSGALGFLIAVVGAPLIMVMRPSGVSMPDRLGLNVTMLLFALGFSTLAGTLVGIVPAFAGGRHDVNSALHDGTRGSSAGRATRLTRHALVVAEFALAIVLLVGAGLLTRSLLQVQSVELGFNPDRVVAMQLAVPDARTSAQRTDYYRRVVEQIRAVGRVEDAAIIGDLFINSAPELGIVVDGGASATPERLKIRRDEVSDTFFSTLRIPLLRGRSFSKEDSADSPRVAVINSVMARRLWPGEEAVGRRFRFGTPASDSPWFTVVGVVGDVRRQGLEADPVAQMFEPLAQNPSRLSTLLVRTSTDPLSMASTLQAAVNRVDTRAPVYGITTLVGRIRQFQAERRFQTSLLLAFAVVALLLAAIGIYGVVQYSTIARTREIGIRVAVGAERRDIFGMIVGEGLKMSAIGLALGLIGSLWLTHLGASLLFDVTATDPLTYVGVSIVLTAVAAAGCYFPARRAARLDPLVALRYE